MSDWGREEVSSHFSRWRAAVDRRDLDEMHSMLAEDARGGNCKSGIFHGRDAVIKFARDNWPEILPNRSIWHVIDGARVVNKWVETLPGDPPSGRDYSYEGISEFIYAGSGKWSFMYGIPDFIGINRAISQWSEDGHAKIYGQLFGNE
jgi:hypothetical protein